MAERVRELYQRQPKCNGVTASYWSVNKLDIVGITASPIVPACTQSISPTPASRQSPETGVSMLNPSTR